MADQETLERLRELVASVGPPVVTVSTRTVSSGVCELDERFGGWPVPGVVEITGAVGSGRLSLVLPSVAMRSRQDEPVVVVDPLALAHPPGWPGIVHRFLLVVRPPPGRAAWATEQIVSSGAVGLIVLLDPPRLGRAGARLVRAVERGGSTLLVVSERPEKGLSAALRLEVKNRRVRVLRCRGSRSDGQEFGLPVAAPLAASVVTDDVIGQPGSGVS